MYFLNNFYIREKYVQLNFMIPVECPHDVKTLVVIGRDEAGEEGKCCINSYSAPEESEDLVLPKISTSENSSVIHFNIFLWFKGLQGTFSHPE